MEKIREQRPDLVLMDLKMPVMDGFEACGRIKADPELKSIPVVAVTASSEKTGEELTGFDGHLRKPVSSAELLEEICRHLKCADEEDDTPCDEGDDETIGDEIADVDQLLSVLRNEFIDRWESFRERQPLKEAAQFGKDIQDLGERHHSGTLVNYGRSLRDSIERFDIENMRETLWAFPDLIKKLEAAAGSSVRSEVP